MHKNINIHVQKCENFENVCSTKPHISNHDEIVHHVHNHLLGLGMFCCMSHLM